MTVANKRFHIEKGKFIKHPASQWKVRREGGVWTPDGGRAPSSAIKVNYRREGEEGIDYWRHMTSPGRDRARMYAKNRTEPTLGGCGAL
jgi:hypothetical protein